MQLEAAERERDHEREERNREREQMQATIDDLRARLDRAESRIAGLLPASPSRSAGGGCGGGAKSCQPCCILRGWPVLPDRGR